MTDTITEGGLRLRSVSRETGSCEGMTRDFGTLVTAVLGALCDEIERDGRRDCPRVGWGWRERCEVRAARMVAEGNHPTPPLGIFHAEDAASRPARFHVKQPVSWLHCGWFGLRRRMLGLRRGRVLCRVLLRIGLCRK